MFRGCSQFKVSESLLLSLYRGTPWRRFLAERIMFSGVGIKRISTKIREAYRQEHRLEINWVNLHVTGKIK